GGPHRIGMDSISDGSPWVPAVLIIDRLDRIFRSDVLAVLSFLAVSLYFAFFGNRLDLLLTILFFAYSNSVAITNWMRDSTALHNLALYGIYAFASWIIFRLVRSTFSAERAAS